jgi:hypothetical protein
MAEPSGRSIDAVGWATMPWSARPALAYLESDCRLSRMPRFPSKGSGDGMQVPPEILKTVAFIGARRKLSGGQSSRLHILGTAFIVGEPLVEEEPDARILFAITAAHVVKKIAERTDDGKSYVRVNDVDGGSVVGFVKLSEWVLHDDPRIDAAATVFWMDPKYDLHFIGTESFVTDQLIKEEQIGPGDDLFFPGLFSKHHGRQANLPILRLGNIASMPSEPVRTKDYGAMMAYLAEARSIGGLSGSPVFVHTGPFRAKDGRNLSWCGPKAWLLGLIHGHWDFDDTPDSEDDDLTEDAAGQSMNMGIAVVVPATCIRELLDQPIFRRIKEQAREVYEKIKRGECTQEDVANQIRKLASSE